jgi:hypothetical protein
MTWSVLASPVGDAVRFHFLLRWRWGAISRLSVVRRCFVSVMKIRIAGWLRWCDLLTFLPDD